MCPNHSQPDPTQQYEHHELPASPTQWGPPPQPAPPAKSRVGLILGLVGGFLALLLVVSGGVAFALSGGDEPKPPVGPSAQPPSETPSASPTPSESPTMSPAERADSYMNSWLDAAGLSGTPVVLVTTDQEYTCGDAVKYNGDDENARPVDQCGGKFYVMEAAFFAKDLAGVDAVTTMEMSYYILAKNGLDITDATASCLSGATVADAEEQFLSHEDAVKVGAEYNKSGLLETFAHGYKNGAKSCFE